MDASRPVWHYTRNDAIEKIIANHELWAGDVGTLNDSLELHLGNKRVRQSFRDLRDTWDWHDDANPEIDFEELGEVLEGAAFDVFQGSAYVTCFTPDSDDTGQWQKYAGATGFALSIPEGVYLPVLGEDPIEPVWGAYVEESPFRWLTLRYNKREQLEIARRAIWYVQEGIEEGAFIDARHDAGDNFGSIFRDRGSSGYVDAVASIKHRDFRSEREVRYAVERPNNPSAIHLSPGGSAHLRLTGASENPLGTLWNRHDPPYYQATPSLLPILSIRVGPGNDFEAVKPWLRAILDANGYDHVAIERSKSPLR